MKVGVIMGGVSSERDISLLTGQEMMAHLDPSKYEAIPIEINDKRDLINKTEGIDIALLALHGQYGEDGTVQATLESMGIPYTGSSVLSSSICMDKDVSKKLLRYEGLHTADWLIVSSLEELAEANVESLGFPLVVKPNTGGSSIGTRIVRSRDKLKAAVADALQWDRSVMIEQWIEGQEITCSILDGKLLPIVSIKPNAEFFDYTSKYAEGEAEEQVIELPEELQRKVCAAALQCYKALKCSVYARVDIILKDGVPFILEVNTLPGLTRTSLLPKSAAAAGLSFSMLLDAIITSSLSERLRENTTYKE
ncbi:MULTISPECIES: D-alanine--D-alanine ligase [Paenibacillus]|uniref:D-alanine--D-alanine ligase n=2 Tax=Paenibacillus lactis TaxID=228574 RepID=G4H8Z4_9BACL|nr:MULTISPECIES: D-alanine--D-alanine ligase [Paenibacillus]EHB68329.1 D-alanine/D-alanine ligase [Paenibacillus lactis 154]MBP1894280.1 D-alanine-D-alanine ligase [Paenibacillus lactis]HAF99545.1 D-alanine--D-alanine ligase [Paenibacillus lactis]